jgi:hypothetical protein
MVAALLAAPVIVEAGQSVQAAGGGGPLSSAGSVTLSNLHGVVGSDALQNPEVHAPEGDEGAPDDQPQGGAAPRVRASQIKAAGDELSLTFAGLNHRDNRLANGGNQFSSEPPDQALCVGPNHVLEGVNTVLRVYDKMGHPVTDTLSYNEFFGYKPAINRTTGEFGAFLTDPICHFDPESQRFFMAVLTLDQDPKSGDFTGANRLDIAVSNSDDPTGTWTRYKLAVQNDGTENTPNHHCDADPAPPADETHPAACIGDFPHVGTDNYGVYFTTNEYSFFGDGSNGGAAYTGSQIYAFSKSQLVAGAASPTMVSFESPELGPFRSFTVWPAIAPAGQSENKNGGTEFFLSSTLGDGSETGNTAPSENRIGVWAITNTSSLDSGSPDLMLSNQLIKASKYTLPPRATQPDGPTPLRDCLNDRTDFFGPGVTCAAGVFGFQPTQHEVLDTLDSSDTRMNQVVYSHGRLYGAIGTGVQVGGSTRAGVLWVNVDPKIKHGMLADAKVKKSGYAAVKDNDLTYPALGVSHGKVVMAVTVTGMDHYPSAGYIMLNDEKPSVRIASEGVGPHDGFTGYVAFVGDPPRTRWGDYGAVAMDGDTLWLASESIEQACTLDQYINTGGSCGGTRTLLANWGTRVSALNIHGNEAGDDNGHGDDKGRH